MMSNVSEWIEGILISRVPDKYYDVHIDELDVKYKKQRSVWIQGLQHLLTIGWQQLSLKEEEVTLAGCLSLKSLPEAIGQNFSNLDELEVNLDATPPSMYMFHKNQEPWNQEDSGFVVCNLRVLSECCLYLEYKDDSEAEYRRSIWILPNPITSK